METVTVHIDGQPFQIEKGQNLLHACLSLGMDLPYFCWHPALHSVGACRQCAVKQFKNEQDTHGKIVMACMTPATDGMRISVNDAEVREFRAAVIEFLMVNHPHDCPVCDEGGECHLQDMTVMAGHDYRHYSFSKRTHRNLDLGPFVNHEMNRCIACYRCVRYYRDFADGRDLDVFGAHDHVYFGRFEDGVLESEFSGNLVEVCPTGVFTDKTLQAHYTRKWDLQTAPSICIHCGLGCNTIPAERYGTLRRVHNRYHHEVNGYFLCDRGRYGYGFVNGFRRISQPLLRETLVTAPEALRHLKSLLANPASIVGIGSPRASLESNFALRQLVGADRFYAGTTSSEFALMRAALDMIRGLPSKPASLRDAALADAVFVLGEDVTNSAPMLALALRQAARNQPIQSAVAQKIPIWHANAIKEVIQDQRGPFFIAACAATRLDDIATETVYRAPDDLARLGFAVAHALDSAAPDPRDISADTTALVQKIASSLKSSARPLVVCGTGLQSVPVLQAGVNIVNALLRLGRPAQLAFSAPECNTMGLAMMEAHDLDNALRDVRDGKAHTVIILENDLSRRADAAAVNNLLASAKHVVIIDHTTNATTGRAEVVLPAATYAETDGTLINNEGRAQRFYAVYPAPREVRPAWRWLWQLARDENPTFDEVVCAMTSSMAPFADIASLAPSATFRIAGEKIARQTHRASGRTAINVNTSIHELPPPVDADSPLAFSMEGFHGDPPPPLIPRYWAPGWNSPQALNKFQEELGGPLKGGDPGRLLLQPATTDQPLPYSTAIPAAFQPRQGEWLLTPIYHIFGSEELSALSPSVAQLTPKPYVAINSNDASTLGLAAGETVAVQTSGITLNLPLQICDTLPAGIAGLPVGLPDQPFVALPVWSRIARTQGL